MDTQFAIRPVPEESPICPGPAGAQLRALRVEVQRALLEGRAHALQDTLRTYIHALSVAGDTCRPTGFVWTVGQHSVCALSSKFDALAARHLLAWSILASGDGDRKERLLACCEAYADAETFATARKPPGTDVEHAARLLSLRAVTARRACAELLLHAEYIAEIPEDAAPGTMR